ncbi:MAG: hypothetical protein H0X37_01350 [Herpetosiphonaceae bacterium]|nr:hypothetical protein [Herpetosiphonaceae bacterium]
MNDNGLGLDNPVMWDLLVAGLLKNLVFRGPIGGGDEPKPINPASLILASAISSVLTSGFPNPEGDGPDPNGPWGPVIRNIFVAVGVAQLASTFTDAGMRRQFQGMAAKAIGAQAERLAQATG